MNLYIDSKNKVLVKTNKTKASLAINKDPAKYGLTLLLKGVSLTMGFEINKEGFGAENEMTATQYLHEFHTH